MKFSNYIRSSITERHHIANSMESPNDSGVPLAKVFGPLLSLVITTHNSPSAHEIDCLR